MIDKITQFLVENQNFFISLIVLYQAYIKAKASKDNADSNNILLNALKIKEKMDADDKFNDKIVDKIEAIGKETNASKTAIEGLKTAVKNKGFKIGSLKGKAIYAHDVLSIGKKIFSIFR